MKLYKTKTLLIINLCLWLSLSTYGQTTNFAPLLCQEIVQSPPNFSQLQKLIEADPEMTNCSCEVLRKIEFLSESQAIINFYAPIISQWALEANSNPDAIVERIKVNPIQIALAREDYALIRFLVSNGVNLNHLSPDGLRPLEYALHSGKKTLADFLIRMGAKPSKMTIGCPVDVNFARYFINRGAKPSTVNIECALMNQKHAEALLALNPNFKGSNLSDYSFNELIEKPKLLTFLLQNKFSPNSFNNTIEKRTLLSLAAEIGKKEVINLLLKFSAQVDLEDAEGLTPLCHATMNNQMTIVEMLIQNGAKVNIPIKFAKTQTPLSFSITQKNTDLAELLLKNGANISLSDVDILKVAVENRDNKLVGLLIEYGANAQRLLDLYGMDYLFAHPTTMAFVVKMGALNNGDSMNFVVKAVKEGKEDLASLLIKNQTGLSNIDNEGKSALHYAFEQKNYALAYQLIDNGANPNQKIEDFEPFLHRAIRDNNLVMVHKLLQNNVEINTLSFSDQSALKLAIEGKNIQIAQLLMKNGAEITCNDLFLAIEKEHFSMVKQMVKYGADLSCSNRGKSVVQYAKKKNLSPQIAQFLKGQNNN
jgi:ankyrin repeat protein